MRVHVELPADPLIDYWGFCKSIAQAVCPAGERDLVGLECIVGKIVRHQVPMEPAARSGLWPNEAALQSVLISDDGRTLDQLSRDYVAGPVDGSSALLLADPARVQVVELLLPYALTDDDRRALEKLLPQLPELRYPMSEDDSAAFMDAYIRLKDRPAWEPALVTAQTIERRKAEQDALMRHHQQVLQQEFAHGRLVAVDSKHVPAAVLSGGYYIPREQAIAYLNRFGIVWRDQETVAERSVPESREPEMHPEPPDEARSEVGKPKLSEQQRRAIVERHNALKLGGNKRFCKQTADEFGITSRYVHELVKAAEAAGSGNRIDHLLASGRK